MFFSVQTMAKRPESAIPGNKRPVSEYAKMVAAANGNMRYKVCVNTITYYHSIILSILAY
jgi:hypothetical protein